MYVIRVLVIASVVAGAPGELGDKEKTPSPRILCSTCGPCTETSPEEWIRFHAGNHDPDPPTPDLWEGDLEGWGSPCLNTVACDDQHICCGGGLASNDCAPEEEQPAIADILSSTRNPKSFATLIARRNLPVELIRDRKAVQLFGCNDAVLAHLPLSAQAYEQLERSLAVRVALGSAGAARRGQPVRHWVLRQLSMLLA